MSRLMEARGLSCSISGRQIIHNIDMDLHAGEVLGLIGPNGAGKSTLLKCLMGYHNYGGMLQVQGRNLSELRGAERAELIAYISQQGPDQLSFSALEVVEMGCYGDLYMGTVQDSLMRARAALDYVGLADLSGRPFNQLSGGEQQLVLFARVLAQDTPILLLDEPTANLDIGHEKTVLEMVTELGREGRAAVIAIHNLNMAAEFCDRLLLMEDGEIVRDAPPDEVLRREHIQRVYNTDVSVSRSPGSGSPQVHPLREFRQHRNIHVHVIGGAGQGVNITRFLMRSGFKVSGGVAHRLDSDTHLWESLKIPMVCVEAFSEIDDAAYEKARVLVGEADYTVLCSFPVGRANVKNLILAAEARQLLIVQDDERSFHSPGAAELFEELGAGAHCLSPHELLKFFTADLSRA